VVESISVSFSMLTFTPPYVWSIVHSSPLCRGCLKSVAEFTCRGGAKFKLTHEPATSSCALAIDLGEKANDARIQLSLDWFALRQSLVVGGVNE